MHLIAMTAALPLAQPAIREEPVPCGRQKVAAALDGRITGDLIVDSRLCAAPTITDARNHIG
jgi:hypothetical protein